MTKEMRENLVQEIEQAFANTVYPGDENIGREETEKFRGDWKVLPLEIIAAGRSDLSFFKPAGFYYYTPSFLRAALLHPEEVDTLLDNLIHNLTPPEIDEDWRTSRFMKIVASFTIDQKKVILKFLENFVDLFPEDRWFYGETGMWHSRLERAMKFWKEDLRRK